MDKNIFCEFKNLSNEDSVENFFVDRLIKRLNYKDDCIKTKTSITELTISKGSKKENYKPDYVLCNKNKTPKIIIEVKNIKEKIEDFEYQVLGYANSLNLKFKNKNPVIYCLLTNGIKTNLYKADEEQSILSLKFEDFKKENLKFIQLCKFISFDNLEQKKKNNFEYKKIGVDEIEGIFSTCHNYIWKKGGKAGSPIEAFYEFSKLFFIKIIFDKKINEDYLSKKRPIDEVPESEFKFCKKWIDKMEDDTDNPVNDLLFKNLLFKLEEQIKEGKRRIFERDEKINLHSGTIKYIVEKLQNINFYGIDEDLNGRMFETFLSSIVRGKELGQYFTPRNVVKFMTKMADIKVSNIPKEINKVFDGCCGSGGFLIDAMDDMISKIDKKNITNEEKNVLKDYIYFHCIWGIDFIQRNTRTARMNLWFHKDGSSNVYCLNTLDKDFQIERGTPDEDKKEVEYFRNQVKGWQFNQKGEKKGEKKEVKKLKFDVILTNPPFSSVFKLDEDDDKRIIEQYEIRYKNLDKEKKEVRNSLKSNVMFIERYYDLLEEKGKLLIVIDESILNADKEKDFRKYILDKFIIKAVVSLPRNTFINADTTTKTSILYLRKKINEDEEQSPIFMAISQNVGHSDSGKPEPEKCDLWGILKKYQEFKNS